MTSHYDKVKKCRVGTMDEKQFLAEAGEARALRRLGEAGFAQVKVEELPHDITNYYYLSRINS